MTTAKVETRLYVPRDVIAITYCNVDFYWDDLDFYDDLWHNIKFDRLDVDILNKKEWKLKKITSEYNSIPTYDWFWGMFFMTEKQKEWAKKSDILYKKMLEAEDDLKDTRKFMFYSATTLFTKAEIMLKEHWFVLKDVSVGWNNCKEETFVYQKD